MYDSVLFVENQSYFLKIMHLRTTHWVVFDGTCIYPCVSDRYLHAMPLHLKLLGDISASPAASPWLAHRITLTRWKSVRRARGTLGVLEFRAIVTRYRNDKSHWVSVLSHHAAFFCSYLTFAFCLRENWWRLFQLITSFFYKNLKYSWMKVLSAW